MTENLYFDHDADIGIIGKGKTLEECFINAATAMFALMGDLSTIKEMKSITFAFEEADTELAFVIWLNTLIAKAQADNLILAKFAIHKIGNRWQGEAWGEPWRDNIERGIDVKGATLTLLSVKKIDNEWEAKCVVDV